MQDFFYSAIKALTWDHRTILDIIHDNLYFHNRGSHIDTMHTDLLLLQT